MLTLMDHPHDIPALAPVYEREILYRVLEGPHGHLLREYESATQFSLEYARSFGLPPSQDAARIVANFREVAP